MIKFASRYPIIFSLLVILLLFAIGRSFEAGGGYLKLSQNVINIISEALICGYVILLLTHLRWWREAGFKQPLTWRKLLAYLPLFFLPVVGTLRVFFEVGVGSVGHMIQLVIFLLMVSFAEEGLFRGVVLRALTPSGLTRSVVLSSLFFGLSHLSSIWGGASLLTTIIQVIVAMLLGIGFAGARLYTGTIWPIIIVHTLTNFATTTNGNFALAPVESFTLRSLTIFFIPALYALYGLWLLRRATIDTATVAVAK